MITMKDVGTKFVVVTMLFVLLMIFSSFFNKVTIIDIIGIGIVSYFIIKYIHIKHN